MSKTDYVLEYAEAVLNNKITAGKRIKQACQRELNDRKKISDKDYPYFFDNDLANKVISLVSVLPTPTGEHIQLALFQKWLIGSLYGWRTKDGNYRRYTKAFISMSRKNSKSFLISTLAVVSLLFDNEPKRNRQILFVANSLAQALISFNMARSALLTLQQSSPYLRRRLKIQKKEIYDVETDSFMRPLPSDATRLDGYNPTTAVIDEFHAAKDNSVYDVLNSGMKQQKNGLLSIISTRGFRRLAMYSDEQNLVKVLDGKQSNDRYFIAIYEQDNKNDIVHLKTDTWEQSNPLFAVDSVKKVMIPSIVNDVKQGLDTDDLTPVLVKSFNRWEQSDKDSFISLNDWDKAQTEPINIDGKEVVFGVDLSKSNDLASISWIIKDQNKLYVDSHSFVGNKENIIEKSRIENINYIELERAGECDISRTDSGVIDYDVIYKWLINFIKIHKLRVTAIAYDPYQMNYLIPRLEKDFTLVETKQNNATLSAPIKDFKDKVLTKTIVHSKNKLLASAVQNAVLIYDSTNSCRLDKRTNSNKIDPLAALLDAYTYLFNEEINYINEQADNDYYSSDFSF